MSRDPGFVIELDVSIEPAESPEPSRRPWWTARTLLALCAVAALLLALFSGGGGSLAVMRPIGGEAEYLALRRVGVEPLAVPELPGVWSDQVWLGGVRRFGIDDAFPAGRYELRLACVGRGQVNVRWWTSTGTEGRLSVPCSEDGEVAADQIVLAEPGMIGTSVGSAAGFTRAVFALALTDPRVVAAQELLGPPGEGTTLTVAQVSTATRSYVQLGAEPGTYRVSLVCVGTGRLRADLSAGAAVRATGDLACTDAGARHEFSVTVTEATQFDLVVLEIGGPPAVSGYALHLDRVPGT